MELRGLREVQVEVAQLGTLLGQVLEYLEDERGYYNFDTNFVTIDSASLTTGVMSSVASSR